MHAPTNDPPSIDACPICARPLALETIEPHRFLHGCDVHRYRCPECGPMRLKIVSRKTAPQHATA